LSKAGGPKGKVRLLMSKQSTQIDFEQLVAPLDPPRGRRTAEFHRLVDQLERELGQLVASILERVRPTVPAWMTENTFLWDEIGDFTRGSVRTQLEGFRRGVLPDRCPEGDAAGAAATAKVGELKALLNGYRICQMTLWETWLDLVEAMVTDTQKRHDLLRRGSEYFFRYTGLLSDYVTDIYEQELERAVRSGEQRRFHAIKALLEGDSSLVDSQLDVDLDQYHLGFVTWGEGGGELARELSTLLGRPMMLIGVLNENWWGWLSSTRPLDPVEEKKMKRFESTNGAGIAVGLEAFGEAGFCATNRQALRARWVGHKTGQKTVFYSDVAVEALASDNQADAHAFVARELHGIDDDSTASLRIRETISAYFAAEHNAASAAAALGVHQQTVANRLRAAEERLGRPVASRRVELEVALRLRACLEPQTG
jgi:hypothetical protein